MSNEVDYKYIISKMKYADKAKAARIYCIIENAWNAVYEKPIECMSEGLASIRDNKVKCVDDSITPLEVLSFCLVEIHKCIGE